MKFTKVQIPASKVQRAAGAARTQADLGRWALDPGRGKGLATPGNTQHGTRNTEHATRNTPLATSQDGVALVITLIMLSVITFLAVTFLVLSQRENAASNVVMDQKTALSATDTAFNRACAEILADGFVNTNFQSFGMKVSTNYINGNGFNAGLNPVQNPTNVNYDHLVGGNNPVTGNAWVENIASLEYNPRAPVFVTTNSGTGANEFRFYLDLNRNGRFDTNGVWPELSGDPNFPLINATNGAFEPVSYTIVGSVLSNNFVGDPEWIGVLERPQEMHSADNKFIARYAYMVVPASSTLDINYIHNHAKQRAPAVDGFFRNEGVGTYEDNLAGLLADLNTNMWWPNSPYGGAYFYNTNPNAISSGLAFVNANDLLKYRYGGTYANLNSAQQLFSNPPAWIPTKVDLYANGPLMLGTSNPPPTYISTRPWAGADNTNHIFSAQDWFNSSLLPGSSFPNNLKSLGGSNDSYNAYTYYRLLSQLGSDSAPEQYKLNVNWDNTDTNGNIIPGSETNQIPWVPAKFFTNAADRMFRQLNMHDLEGKLITVTNIPFYELPASGSVYGTTNINYYTPAVHRVLQLAANIYDATSSRFIGGGPTNYPSVFRPIFTRYPNGVGAIVGYTEVTNTADAFMLFSTQSNYCLRGPLNRPDSRVNLYGIPWVIGAKKGFPNFNAMHLVNSLGVQREIAFTNKTAAASWQTNQLFNFYLTNRIDIDAWNSYTNAYGRPLTLWVSNQFNVTIINGTNNQPGAPVLLQASVPYGTATNLPIWPGGQRPQTMFFTNALFVNGTYQFNGAVTPINPVLWSITTLPRMSMSFNYRLQYVLVDTFANRIIDFVNLEGPQPQLQPLVNDPIDISMALAANANEARVDTSGTSPTHGSDIFATNFQGGILMGVLNQIYAEMPAGFGITLPGTVHDPSFINKLNGNAAFDEPSSISEIDQQISWEANDPLVHYTAPDLTSLEGKEKAHNTVLLAPPGTTPQTVNQMMPDIGGDPINHLNYATRPWPNNSQNPDPAPNGSDGNFQMKDVLQVNSDAWDFPTNKLWDIGVLGRVHRGTPWQTIYLKPYVAAPQTLANWNNWVNDNVVVTNNSFFPILDGFFSTPNQDYLLFDLFTSAPNDNATRGQLNINQTGLADWSAILSGVNVLSNTPGGGVAPFTIQPAGAYNPNNPTPVAVIWRGITNMMAHTNPAVGPVFPNGAFQHLGDILNTPELTISSPFLDRNDPTATATNDEVLERIPQQVMSLLTLNQNPRFVIYSFGQTLHPANNSLVVGGTFNGLCTNYQITAETATRAVVRVDGSPDPKYTYPNNPDPQGRFYPPHLVVEQFNVLGPD